MNLTCHFPRRASSKQNDRLSANKLIGRIVGFIGGLLSAIFLDEMILEWKNAVALLLMCGGIWLVTKDDMK